MLRDKDGNDGNHYYYNYALSLISSQKMTMIVYMLKQLTVFKVIGENTIFLSIHQL